MIAADNRKTVFRWWLDRGFKLLPVQPNRKYLVAGFGQYQAKIESIDQANFYHLQNYNLAVLADGDRIILDFDNPYLYRQWVESHSAIAKTYTETTPRGGVHVFFYGRCPSGLQLVDGVEIKKVCVVFPSSLNEKRYIAGAGEILRADPDQIFSSLSKTGTKTVYRLQADQHRKPNKPVFSHSAIETIKQHYTIEQVFRLYHPEIELMQKGKVITCKCVFHDDKNPSFYILPEIGVWGCHACHIRGDVINLYARFEHIDNREAITRMTQSLGLQK